MVLSIARHDPVYKVSDGVDSCATTFFAFMSASEDQTFTLSSVQIKVRSDGTATSIAQHDVTGTKIVYVDPRKIPLLLQLCTPKSIEGEHQFMMLPRLPTPPFLVVLAKQIAVLSKQNSDALKMLKAALPNSPDRDLLYDYISSLVRCILQMESAKFDVSETKSSPNLIHHPNSPSTSANSSQFDCSNLPLFLISEEENNYLFNEFDKDVVRTVEGVELSSRTEELSLAMGYPFTYSGELQLHLDQDSRVHLNRWTIFLRLPPFQI